MVEKVFYNYHDHDDEADEADENIDNEWVDEYKKEEEYYTDFYKEPVTTIKLFFLYVNKEKELEIITNEPFFLKKGSNVIHKEELITIIKNKQLEKERKYNIKYKLISLYRYNPMLEPEDINVFIQPVSFIENENENEKKNTFFIKEKYLTDIEYMDTITIFQDLNSLFFIFYEYNKHNNINNKHNVTKKIIKVDLTTSKYKKKIKQKFTRRNTR
jgi:hypothetical protein